MAGDGCRVLIVPEPMGQTVGGRSADVGLGHVEDGQLCLREQGAERRVRAGRLQRRRLEDQRCIVGAVRTGSVVAARHEVLREVDERFGRRGNVSEPHRAAATCCEEPRSDVVRGGLLPHEVGQLHELLDVARRLVAEPEQPRSGRALLGRQVICALGPDHGLRHVARVCEQPGERPGDVGVGRIRLGHARGEHSERVLGLRRHTGRGHRPYQVVDGVLEFARVGCPADGLQFSGDVHRVVCGHDEPHSPRPATRAIRACEYTSSQCG